MAALAPFFTAKFWDGAAVAASYLVWTFENGTTTPKASYTTAAGDVENTNPIVLNAAGECDLWLGTGTYTLRLNRTVALGGGVVETWDGVAGTAAVDTTQDYEQLFTATAGQTVFDLTLFSYTTGTKSVQVFVNGLMLKRVTDYAETSSTRITLTSGAELADEVTIRAGVDVGGDLVFNVEIQIFCSDMTTALVAGTGKAYTRAPRAFTITEVFSSLFEASSSGLPTVDINKNGSTILSTKLTIDANETISTTAATPYVLSSTSVAKYDLLTFDIDVAGTGAKGLIVTILGTAT